MSGTDAEVLMTPIEVSRSLRIAVSTVYEAAATGRLPCIRLWRGKRKSVVRFRRAEIEALIRGEGSAPMAPRSLPTK
ncbi:MAG TPA: helix-turn-helix domain-containing protein [Dehalococcoidia bacterium]|nr:helix-turn-helix domain-containing protein [Dehalococcoidia bacterium]